MEKVTKGQVIEALRAVGVKPGDGLLIHSAIQFLGRPEGGVGLYFDALCEAVRCESRIRNNPSQFLPHNSLLPSGTLAVPTFNFAFARGEAYDPQATPSAGMGVFSEYVRQQPEARRTPHPLQSLAVIGRYAEDLEGRDTPGAFDPGSAFERLLELDFKLLLLGANIQSVSMLHYSEQRAEVPYRYWKDFSGPVRAERGWETRTYRMFARDLNTNSKIELYPVQTLLVKRDQWHSAPLNYGEVALCRLADFVEAVDEFLFRDPWSLVVNKGEAQK